MTGTTQRPRAALPPRLRDLPIFDRSLRAYLFSRITGVVLLVFAAVLFTATILYNRLLTSQAQDTAAAIAGQTHASLEAFMDLGPSREQLLTAIASIKASHARSPYRIEVYRSPLVDTRFGALAHAPSDQVAERVMAGGGAELTLENGTWTRHFFPLTARASCLACHDNAQPGQVLGVVEVKQNVNTMVARMRTGHAWLFLFYAAAAVGFALCITLLVSGRVARAVHAFRARTDEIHSVIDLTMLQKPDETSFGFSELDHAFNAVRELAGRLRDVAVDREILEFEIKILDKFIITSNVVKDWRKFIKELLVDINSIIDTYALFAMFHENETDYELDVFWRSAPTDDIITAYMEDLIKKRFADRFRIAGLDPTITINHHDCGSEVPLPQALTLKDIELRTKSLFLDAPKIGGIVGIGVQSNLVTDSVFHIVLDSALFTLINVVGSVKAISKYTRDLEYYATRDPLTHLYNQRMFWDLLEYEIHRSERHDSSFGLLMIDVDNFKAINDRNGHAFGDFFLQRLADILHQAVRNGDFVARYGGDEFVVFLPETPREQAYSVAVRIMESAAAMVAVTPDGAKVQSTVSIGMSMYPEHGKNGRDLFLVADNMMYKVKDEGKNALAEPEEGDVAEIFKHENEINFQVFQALENRNVVPHFQPILDLVTGEVTAHEVLMRMSTNGDTVLTAGEFIKAAERIGLLPKLDQVLMEKTFETVGQAGYRKKLFINLTPKALIIPEFLATILRLSKQYDINPERVVFEVTERDTVKNVAMLQKFVSRMKSEGFAFAVDDFGSGYSSYKYLKLFPIDYVKIEGEFIRNLLVDADFLAYTKSIVTLAHELKVKTIAEYVEDEEILNQCRALGIDYGQGYHIGRPGPDFLQPGAA